MVRWWLTRFRAVGLRWLGGRLTRVPKCCGYIAGFWDNVWEYQ